MTVDKIWFRKGYKYVLSRPYSVQLSFKPDYPFPTEWFRLGTDGVLFINQSYAWDGASGPAIDDQTNMRGSLIHDVLCQAIRLGLLPESFAPLVHQELERICLEDGMISVRAGYYERAVAWFGGRYAKKGTEPGEISAP